MKVVAYSVKPFEKACLAKANNKKHDITLISNSLSAETAFYAEGKDAVIVFTNDDVSEKVISILADYGIKYIATRSTGIDHIDNIAAKKYGIKIANVTSYSSQNIVEEKLMEMHNVSIPTPAFLNDDVIQQIAEQTIKNLDYWREEELQTLANEK